MADVFLALGTNIGNKRQYIAQAITCLSHKVTITKQASIYETKPVGYLQQDTFYNTVIGGLTNLSYEQLLLFIQSIEVKLGRVNRFKNGPREIDIDLLLYDFLIVQSDTIIIPHPRMHEREFVLRPLVGIAPFVVHPVYKKTMQDLYLELPKEAKSVISLVSE